MPQEQYQPTTGTINGLSRHEGLMADIDLRLMDRYPDLVEAAEHNGWDLAAILPFMRLAYGDGRMDERIADPNPDEIYTSHGYRVPPRRAVKTQPPDINSSSLEARRG